MLEKLITKNVYKLSVLGTKEVNEKGFAWVDVPALNLEVFVSLEEIEERGNVYVLKNAKVRKFDDDEKDVIALDKIANLKNPKGESASLAYLRRNGYAGCTATIKGVKFTITKELDNGFEAILENDFIFDVQ